MRKKLSALWQGFGQVIIRQSNDQTLMALVRKIVDAESFKQGTRLDSQRYYFKFEEDVLLNEGDQLMYLDQTYKVMDYQPLVSFQEKYWQAEVEQMIQTKSGSFYDD